MSTYYNIITEATIEDVSLSADIHVEDGDIVNYYYLTDKYLNTLACMTEDDGRILRVKRFGKNDPTYILYALVVDYNSLVLDEYTVYEMTHNSDRPTDPDKEWIVSAGTSYEEFTCSLLNYLKDDEHWYRYDLRRAEHRLNQIENDLFKIENNNNDNKKNKDMIVYNVYNAIRLDKMEIDAPFLREVGENLLIGNNLLVNVTDGGFLSNIVVYNKEDNYQEFLLELIQRNNLLLLTLNDTHGYLQGYDMERSHVSAPYYSISKFAHYKTQEYIYNLEMECENNSKANLNNDQKDDKDDDLSFLQ